MIYLLVGLIFFISINYLIETFSWYIRSITQSNSIGEVISISNMVLYMSRFFNFFYVFSISFYVDHGYDKLFILYAVYVSMIVTALFHYFFFCSGSLLKRLRQFVLFCTIPFNSIHVFFMNNEFFPLKREVLDFKVLYFTFISCFLFCISYFFPFILSSIFPNLRLTIVSIGTVGNFMATIPLVFYVDNKLYKYMDLLNLKQYLYSYVLGRTLGFILFVLFVIGFHIFWIDFL